MTLLIIFAGESNSGGITPNSFLTGTDSAPKPNVQILNNTTLAWQTLQIGVNNLIDHDMRTNNVTHGWELGLANRVAFEPNITFLCKTGQGGSQIATWGTGGVYYTKFLQRINIAKSLLAASNHSYRPILWYTQGINDASRSVPTPEWKTATIAHFAKIRLEFPDIPILFSKIPTLYPTYNVVIDEIAAEISGVYAISVDGATYLDPHHWSYDGMKLIASRMYDQTRLILPAIRRRSRIRLPNFGFIR